MNDISTVIARYRDTLAAYCNNQYVPIATDQYGRVLISHIDQSVSGTGLYSSIRLGDGDDLLSILNIGDTVSGNTGILIFGEDESGEAYPLPLTEDGDKLKVDIPDIVGVSGSIDIDPTPGTDADKHSDESGANTEPGVVDSVGTGAWVDVVSIPLTSGEYVIQSIHAVADRTSQFRLVVDDNGSISTYLGQWLVTQNVASYEFDFPRGREITGQADRSIKLQAIRRAACTVDANVAGRINGFTR